MKIKFTNYEIRMQKIIGSIAQPNWRVIGSKRQFSSDARSSAIPGKLSFDNFA